MPVLIDTDVAIELMRQSPYALDCVSRHDDSIYVSSVTVAELYFGAYNSARPNENVAKVRGFLENFPRVNITDEVAERFGRVKAELRRRSVLGRRRPLDGAGRGRSERQADLYGRPLGGDAGL